jgi:hypothetical protein
MFLKKLWIYNKWIFFLLIFYVLLLLFFNYKGGAIATPVYQFGMYASKYNIKDTQTVCHIYVNNQLLDVSQYSYTDRDKLFISLENYEMQKENNPAVFMTMKRLLCKVGIGQFMDSAVYNNTITDYEFTQWYIKLLEKTIGYKVSSVEVFKQKYVMEAEGLRPIDTLQKQKFIVTE